jgi:hypothetical protein
MSHYFPFKDTAFLLPFPNLADFHYQIWPFFISQFGGFSLPNLAGFHYQIWRKRYV